MMDGEYPFRCDYLGCLKPLGSHNRSPYAVWQNGKVPRGKYNLYYCNLACRVMAEALRAGDFDTEAHWAAHGIHPHYTCSSFPAFMGEP